jgi:hypothetical protein
MFVTAFKRFLGFLPSHDAGYNALKENLRGADSFSNPAAEFFIRLTNYAARRSPAASETHYDPRLFLTALCMTRFPVEILGEPEEPNRFTLLNSAWKYLRMVDTILCMHSEAEDDSVDDFLSESLCIDYMLALNEFHAAWRVVWDMDARGLCSSVGY